MWITLFASLAVSVVHGAPSVLKRADRAFEELRFEEAERLYRRALALPAPRSDRLHTWWRLALSQGFQGNEDGATSAFRILLAIDPDRKVDPSLGPKATRPYQSALKRIGPARPSLSVVRDGSGDLVVTLENDMKLFGAIALFTRTQGSREYTVTLGPPSSPVRVAVDPALSVEAYALGLDRYQGTLLEVGRATDPMVFAAREKPPPVKRPQTDTPERGPSTDAVRPEDASTSTSTATSVERQLSLPTDPVIVRDAAPALPAEAARSTVAPAPLWPWLVGGGVVVAGLAAVFYAQQQALRLPPAERTLQLP